jgi:hypothetical protein
MSDHLARLLPEEHLLMSLCRLDFTGQQKQEIGDLMIKVTDWNYFIRLANEHGIIALVWYNISQTGNGENLPVEVFDKLHAGYLKSLTRNTFLYNHLEEVVTLAKKESIKIVLLKGLALERTVYGNKGLRQMNDLDILVKPEKAIKLRKVLLKNGFESTPIISTIYEKKMFLDGKHLPDMNKKGVSVEIHFRLFSEAGNLLSEEIFEKTNNIPGENALFYPEPQLSFLYLVKHLDKHEKEGDSQLRLYTDLVVLLAENYDQIINEKLFNDANRADIETALYEKFRLLEIFWGISFPVRVKSFSSKIDTELITEKFIGFLRNPENECQNRESYNPLNSLKFISGITNKSLFIIGYLCPSIEYMKYKYKIKTSVLTVFYYPVRWVNIAGWVLGRRRIV